MKTLVAVTLVSLLAISSVQAETVVDTAGFSPLPVNANLPGFTPSSTQIALGKKLFLDKRLSLAKDISCNSCHKLDGFGVDNEATSAGHKGQRGNRNSPTVYNAALHFAQFWDGRAADVEAQALGPVQNPVEMAMPSEAVVLERLQADSEYVKLFKEAFPNEAAPVTFVNMGRAIGAFERQLLTPSRFDDYLNGDKTALTDAELKGMMTFKNAGCMACHNGATLGGGMYQKLGLVKPYPTTDLGRYEVTKNEADKYFFKVPSLRNIEKTGPYFHDGSIKTLDQAVKTMGEYQLGRTFTDAEVAEIVTFLRSLTGRIPQ